MSKREKRSPRRCRIERLEGRRLLAAMLDADSNLRAQFVWPAGGYGALTYTNHQRAHSVDINQDDGSVPHDLNAPVFAAHDGIARVVTTMGSSSYGNSVEITSLDGRFTTYYAHLSTILLAGSSYPVVERNSAGEPTAWALRQGDIFGRVGGTGREVNSFDPHIHMEYRDNRFPNHPTVSMTETAGSETGPPGIEYLKGFFRAKPQSTITESTVALSGNLMNVAVVSPGESLFVNLKGFGWNEEVTYRVRTLAGQTVAGPTTVTTEPENDDDIAEDVAPDLGSFWSTNVSGTYLLEGVERDRASTDKLAFWRDTGQVDANGKKIYVRDSSQDTDFTWASGGYATAFTNQTLVSARPMSVVVSPAVPPAAVSYNNQTMEFDAFLQSLSVSRTPWHLLPSGLLVIAGGTAPISGRSLADEISVTASGSDWVLQHVGVEGLIRIPRAQVTGIFADGLGGGDVIDFREVTVPVFIRGSQGNDVLMGGSANDILLGGEGMDWIEGADGQDWILGGVGADVLFGEGVDPPAGSQLLSDIDYIFGESGDDWLYVRNGDYSHGGEGVDQIHGRTGAWGWSDVPTSHAGVVIISGQENHVTVRRQGNMVIYTTPTRTFSYRSDSFDQVDRGDLLVFGTDQADIFDMRDALTRLRLFSRGGNDHIVGTNYADVIVAGGGVNEVFAGGGADLIFAGAGTNSQLNGGAGDDSLFGSGSGDVLRGEAGRDYFVPATPADHVADATAVDIVGFAARRRQERLDALNNGANRIAVEPQIGTRVSTRVAGITEFTIDRNVVIQGESFLATVRTDRNGVWARMTLYADLNGNGRYDSLSDIQLTRTRGRTLDYRGHVRTAELAAGSYQIYARLEGADGSIAQSQPLTLTVQSAPAGPTVLPPFLNLTGLVADLVVMHKNGDATLPDNDIVGIGQMDLYRFTVGTSGNHAFSTTGIETIRGLYDASGMLMGTPVAGGNALIANLTEAETYYLAVAPRFSETGTYDLGITGRNQISNGAIDTPPGNYAGTVSGEFGTGNTIDYWEINAPATATLLDIDVSAEEGVDLWVRVADTDNNVIALANLAVNGSAENLRDLLVDGGKTYYVTVHGLYGATGTYSLTADFYPDDAGLPATIHVPTALANYEPLIPQADGDYILPSQSIVQQGEFKYYLISPTYDGDFILRTLGTTNTLLGLYSGNGAELLAFSDDDGPGENGQIEYGMTGGEEYWLVVRGVNTATGEFVVEVIGPPQYQEPILVSGLARQGERSYSLGVSHERQTYFSVVAPEGSETLDISAWPTDPNRPMDLLWSIEDEAGNIVTVDLVGIDGTETFSGYGVIAGQTYTFTVTSKDRAPGSGRIALDFAPDGDGSGEFIVNSTNWEDQNTPRVSMNANGQAVAVWQSFEQNADYDIFLQRFSASGVPIGTEIRANNADSFVNQYDPDVAIAADGSFWVAWGTDTDSQIRLRRFNSLGQPITGEINTGISAFSRRIAISTSGTLVVLGTNGSQIVARAYGSNGSPAGSLRILDDPPGNNDVIDIAVAARGNGGFVASWTRESNQYDVIAQRLDLLANKVGSEVLVFASPRPQFSSDIAATEDGRFAVALRQIDNDGTLSNIYLTKFDADANQVGMVRRVNMIDAGNQEHPSVFIKADGSTVVTWTTPGLDGSAKGVAYQQFDQFNNPFNIFEQPLNEFSEGDQQRLVISGNGLDTFFGVWESYRQDGNGNAIAARRFELATPPPAPRVIVNEQSGDANDNHLQFTRQTIGSDPLRQTVQVVNGGSAMLSGTIVSNSSRFTLIGDGGFALLPGEWIDFEVEMETDVIGRFTGELQIDHNASGDPVIVTMAGVVSPQADVLEPNNNDEEAVDLGVVSDLLLSGLTIDQEGDEDWFQFSVDQFSEVVVDVQHQHHQGDLTLVAYDWNLSLIEISGSNDDDEQIVFNIDAGQPFYVRVYAEDDAINVYSLAVNATTVNRRPVMLSQAIEVVETHPAGMVFGTVLASDPDPGQTLSYAITGGEGSELFTIDEVTGEVSVAAGMELDFEEAPYYSLQVEVTDNGLPGLSASATVNILLQNVAEVVSLQWGDGTVQRSLVNSATVTFDSFVDFEGDDLLAAFTLIERSTGSVVEMAVESIDETGLGTAITFVFSGNHTRGAMNALMDGNYQFDVVGDRVFVEGTTRPGVDYRLGDNVGGDDRLFALYGDNDGDRVVGFTDFVAFRSSFGSAIDDTHYAAILDYEGDEVIGFTDFVAFRSRFGSNLGA